MPLSNVYLRRSQRFSHALGRTIQLIFKQHKICKTLCPPVYVRSNGKTGKGLEALRHKGSSPWPNPETPEALAEVLAVEERSRKAAPGQNERFSSVREEPRQAYESPQSWLPINDSPPPLSIESPLVPADALFAKVRELLGKMKTPKPDAEVAAD